MYFHFKKKTHKLKLLHLENTLYVSFIIFGFKLVLLNFKLFILNKQFFLLFPYSFSPSLQLISCPILCSLFLKPCCFLVHQVTHADAEQTSRL